MAFQMPSWGDILYGACGLIGGGAGLKIGEALFGKETRQVKALSDTIDTLAAQLKSADERQDRFGDRLDDAEADLADCKGHHETCRQDLGEVNRRLDLAHKEIERLMAEQPPAGPYTQITRPTVLARARSRKPKT